MAKKMSERPFHLVGFTSQDYSEWCLANGKKERATSSKKEFFRLIFNYQLIKKDGKVIDMTKGEK